MQRQLTSIAGGPRPRPATAARRSEAVERVVRMMRQHLDQPLPLETMARVAALSMHHFARVFHEVTGMPPARFLAALRLAEAKRLLLMTTMSVTDVCYRVGYNSLGSFAMRFTQSVGTSPGRFRRLRPAGAVTGGAVAAGAVTTGAVADAGGRSTDRAADGQVTGRVFAATRPVFIGLFRTPIPEGLPVRCTVLPHDGAYRIDGVPDGIYHLFAVSFTDPDDAPAMRLAADASLRVATVPGAIRVGRGAVVDGLDLRLRPMLPTDPPILVALPTPAEIR